MKIYNLSFAFIFLLSSIAFADSPLTSTEFYKAYDADPILQEVSKSNGVLSDKLMDFLEDFSQPIDVKMALINKLGWDSKGKNNATLFINFLIQKRKFSSINDIKKNASSQELICIGYLMAMDNYFNVKKALEFSHLAVKRDKNSFTIHIINALIEAQTIKFKNWCRIYKVVQNVIDFPNLTMDFKTEATQIIANYTSSYKEYCTLNNPNS